MNDSKNAFSSSSDHRGPSAADFEGVPLLPFFFCVSGGGGGVQIRARTRAPSSEGGTSFCHTRATASRKGKFTRRGQRRGSAGRLPPTCRARTLKVHRREPPGTARVCCGPLSRARLPPPSRPQRFNHPIGTTTALRCVGNPRRFFLADVRNSAPAARCWRVPSDHRSGGD